MLNFKQGGLTNGQIEVLYTHALKRDMEQFRLLAALHGASVDDGEDRNEFVGTEFEGCVNGMPETYKHLTDEQKKRWSDILMSKHSLAV